MSASTLPIPEKGILPCADKAVRCFVYSRFPRLFSEEEIEDMVSDVALRVWDARDRFDPARGSFTTWVGVIARNVVISAVRLSVVRADIADRLRGGRPSEEDGAFSYRGDEFEADRELRLREICEGFYSALRTEREQRFLTWLLDGLEPGEMAQREGVTTGNAYTILSRLRVRLRNAA